MVGMLQLQQERQILIETLKKCREMVYDINMNEMIVDILRKMGECVDCGGEGDLSGGNSE